ncbi:MAG: HEAT repeat domain-containing protein [Planctomycetota bacterium]
MKRVFLMTWLAVAAGSLPAPAQENDPDRHKSATALFYEGYRAETGPKPNLPVAIAKYKKAAAKAKEEKNGEIGAQALVRLAGCYEKQEPENIAEAKAAYEDAVSSFGDVKPWADLARERVSYKGVDVWLRRLHAALDPWRISADRSPLTLAEKKAETWKKIEPLDTEAVPGLLWGLGHPDEVIRTFAAECLVEVVDEAGVTAVVGKLNDANPNVRAGAAAAFQKIFQKWSDARDLERRASELERDLEIPLQPDSRASAHHAKLREEASKLRKAADEIRRHIPANLATAEIQAALERIIADENADSQARREAAQAASGIGNISGSLVDALLKGIQSKDRNVREACVRAAGAVDTSVGTDKHRLADALIRAVQYEPARDPNPSEADWPNDEAVRQAAAEALERIGLIKSLPALIEALDDNDARVRHAAFRALSRITERDLEYDKDDKGLPRTYEPDRPLQERRKAQAKWKEWWEQTGGIPVLVERFWAFQAQWKDVNAAKLFDPESFLREVESRLWSAVDPKAAEDRAKRVLEDFQRRKDVFVQDAVDLGAEAFDRLLAFLGGKLEKDPKGNAALRAFVAQACARIVEKHSPPQANDKLRDKLLQGEDGAQKAGGALALGFLPRSLVQAADRQALQGQGLSATEPEVREAAAWALSKVGEESAAADLTRVASSDADPNVQAAALRAIFALKPRQPDTIKTLGDMVADEPDAPGGPTRKARDKNVRALAVEALGEIGDASATPYLLRARRDEMRVVREAASVALRKVHKADAKTASEECLKVVRDERRKTEDRIGAALSLGDMAEPAYAKALSERLVDLNPPRVLRDPDPGVRMALCRAIGAMGEKAKLRSVVERLIQSMGDESGRETQDVRNAAYEALKQVTGINPDAEGSADAARKFRASDEKTNREAAVRAWVQWFEAEKANLRDAE